jgi:arylsulfatase A
MSCSLCPGIHRKAVAALACLLLVMAMPNGLAAESTNSRPPNFVFILVDDLGPEQLGCYGNPTVKTPNIDRLASEGMRFKTCYTAPVCSPSRVLLLTGRYGFRTGWRNFTGRPGSPTATDPGYDLGTAEKTFAHVLKANGYRTGLAGRWLECGNEHKQILSAGFDDYIIWAIWGNKLPEGVTHTGAWENRERQVTSRFWNPCLIRDGKYVPTGTNDYAPDLILDYCREFLRANRSRPFVLYYPMILVHSPFDPVPDLANPGKRKDGNLKEFVEHADHLVGRLIQELDQLGLRSNTVVFFAGDNGTAGQGKSTPTEKGARVPFIVRCPDTVKSKIVTDALTDFSDVFPTLLDFAGIPMPEKITFDGQSLRPVLLGQQDEHRPWIYSYFRNAHVIRNNRWLLEGDGRLFDCGDDRDGNYTDVTAKDDPEVLAAQKTFEWILKGLKD